MLFAWQPDEVCNGAPSVTLNVDGNGAYGVKTPSATFVTSAECTIAVGTTILLIYNSTYGFIVVEPNPGTISVNSCGTTTTCGNSLEIGQVVYGSAPLVSGTPSTATITGISPTFTYTTSYNCTVSAESGAATQALLSVANVSPSSFTITGPATSTTVINYICAGY
jgi:hypothetical protein